VPRIRLCWYFAGGFFKGAGGSHKRSTGIAPRRGPRAHLSQRLNQRLLEELRAIENYCRPAFIAISFVSRRRRVEPRDITRVITRGIKLAWGSCGRPPVAVTFAAAVTKSRRKENSSSAGWASCRASRKSRRLAATRSEQSRRFSRGGLFTRSKFL